MYNREVQLTLALMSTWAHREQAEGEQNSQTPVRKEEGGSVSTQIILGAQTHLKCTADSVHQILNCRC